jgi:hypothetical protein
VCCTGVPLDAKQLRRVPAVDGQPGFDRVQRSVVPVLPLLPDGDVVAAVPADAKLPLVPRTVTTPQHLRHLCMEQSLQ